MKAKKTGLVVAATRTCGKPARHGPPCGLDPAHVKRGERHSNGQFTWALRGKEAQQSDQKEQPMATESVCGVSDPKGKTCALPRGHKGMHYAGSGFHWNGTVKSKPTSLPAAGKKAKPSPPDELLGKYRRDQAEERAASAKAKKPTVPAPSKYCGAFEDGATVGRVCTLPPGHDGDHDSGVKKWPQTPPVTDSEERTSSWWSEWERIGKPDIDVRTVSCPTCKATAGYCKRPSGHKAMSAHAARWDAALLKAARAYDEKHCGGCGVERDKPHAETCPSPLAALNREAKKKSADPNIIELENGTLYDRRSPIGPPVKLPESWTKKPAKPKKTKAPRVCANYARDPSTGKPFKGAHAKCCERELGHEGPHRIGPRGDLEHVVEWNDSEPGLVAYNRKAQRPMTLDDEPEDPEADAAAIAAMDADAAARANLEPEEDEDDNDPRAARWHCEEPFVATDGREYKCEGRNEHGGAHYAWSVVQGKTLYAAVAENEEGGDPFEDEVRSDEDRNFAREQRELREAHARALEADNAPKTGGMRILGYRRHAAAALFPLLEGEAFEKFADRVQANGLRDPIVLVKLGGEEWILDGSNRALACEQRGIAARFQHYEGPKDLASLVAYSIDKNGEGRRHLDPSVRAMIALEAATLGQGNPGKRETGGAAGLTQAEAGKRLGVGERLVRKAKVVRDKGTAKVKQAVMAGKMTVEAAEVVTKLSPAKQDELADQALSKSTPIKSGRVRALVKQEEKRSVVRKINEGRVAPLPMGPFGVIYADYPWLFENSDQHEGSRGHMGYPPMTIEEILAHAFEAAKRAAKDCILALWVPNWHLVTQVGRVVEAYGAEHRTVFTWPKPKAGVGTWGRGQSEHLVIASIGAPVHTLNEVSTLLPSWQPAHPGEHSSKPAEVAELLAKHCAGPFLELFAREEREGWTCWGAEVDKFTEAA